MAHAFRHVTEGERHIASQREVVGKLEADGHTALAVEARALLAQFEELQALRIVDRDRLQELGLA